MPANKQLSFVVLAIDPTSTNGYFLMNFVFNAGSGTYDVYVQDVPNSDHQALAANVQAVGVPLSGTGGGGTGITIGQTVNGGTPNSILIVDGSRNLDQLPEADFGPGGADGDLQFNNAGVFDGSLLKQIANAIQQRNGANPQAFQVYSVFNSPTDYARLALLAGSNFTALAVEQQTSNPLDNATLFISNAMPGALITLQTLAGSWTMRPNGDLLPGNAGAQSLGSAVLGNKQYFLDGTITPAGTTGDQIINKARGTVNIAAAGDTVTVTNSLVTVDSIVIPVLRTNDLTATVKNVVCSAGSFTINLTSAAAAEVSIGFVVHN